MQNAGHTRIGGPRRKRRRMSLAGGQQVDDPMDHPDLSSSEGEIGLEHNIEHDSWGSETEEQEKKWESTWEAGLSVCCCSRTYCSFSHAPCFVLRFLTFSYGFGASSQTFLAQPQRDSNDTSPWFCFDLVNASERARQA
jgi:hypothetical protein